MRNIHSYLPDTINLELFDPASGLPGDLGDARGLLVRTVIPINKKTLPRIPDRLDFVGTASAGSDHVDIEYLEQEGVAFADAAGCNSRSVAEYVATALLLWSEHTGNDLRDLAVGIVGVGNVGTEVAALLDRLDIHSVAYDPPRQEREADFNSDSLDDLLRCDILSFHTPLTGEGPHPTFHWLDARKLAGNRYELIINTSRGGVIDEEAVLEAKKNNRIGDIVIDVWENEPEFHLPTARNAFIKTPHIAGYSVQAKERASELAANALLNHFGLKKPQNQRVEGSRVLNTDVSAFDSLSSLLTELHPIREYERKLENIIAEDPGGRGEKFNELRANFPLRQEFRHIYLPPAYFDRFPVLRKLDFKSTEQLESE